MSVVTSPGFQLDPDTPLGRLVGWADTAFANGDVSTMDDSYLTAVRLAHGPLRAALAADHVSRLLALDRTSLAWTRCTGHLAAPETASPVLRLRRAEVLSRVGAHDHAARAAAGVRAEFATDPLVLGDDEQARLLRVAGLAAADQGDFDRAEQCLVTARKLFRAVGDLAAAEVIECDRRLLAILRDGPRSGFQPTTVAERLAMARRLRAQWRYTAAYQVLLPADTPDLDPALRLPVLAELCRLLRLLRAEQAADALIERLADAAAQSPDPGAAQIVRALRRPDDPAEPGDLAADPPDRTDLAIQHARKLTLANRLTEAERLLVELHPKATTNQEAATGQLAMGELRLTWYARLARKTDLDKAIHHLAAAVRHAETDATLVETHILALRTLGRAYYARARPPDRPRDNTNPDQLASECWRAAHRLEELLAARQDRPEDRARMLLAAINEHDERMRAAAAAIERQGGVAVAELVAAMESAKGATILDDIRDLPASHDSAAAWRWLHELCRDLADEQAIWLMYQTADRLHHIVVGNGLLQHLTTRLSRVEFGRTVGQFVGSTTPTMLEAGVRNGTFDRLLTEMSQDIAAADVLALLPERITRIAVMAGGELAVVPFAALPVSGSTGWLGHRYALSDLPSLSARRPLWNRSARQRGDRSLLVRSPEPKYTEAAPLARCHPLPDPQATVAGLATELATGRCRWLRIDSHGQHDPEQPEQSWLQIGADAEDGRLRADMMRKLDLHRCGTVVLGACETGMAQRRGRDERVGFVRTAFQAGAAAVVAARWASEDRAAAWVLNRFGRHLRYLPRDIALQRAQVDLCATEPALAHPAQWGCWTLYGDPGWQTSAGPLRRLARRELDRFRTHDRRHGDVSDER